MINKVLVTGYGGITAAGETIEKTWKAIKSGQTGINKITHWDLSSWEYSLGGEIKNYDAKHLVPDRKLLKLLSRQDVLGLNAVMQAVEHSGILKDRATSEEVEAFNERTGIYVGSPGNKFNQQYDFLPLFMKSRADVKLFAEGLMESIHPMWLLKVLPNNVLAYTGIKYGFKGSNQNITNHAVSGVQAVLEAYHAIHEGRIDRAVVVAYDYGIGPQELMYYQGAGLLSKTALRSFDVARNGTIMGEGAGALILESSEAAAKRNACIYGEVLSGASTSESEAILSHGPLGEGVIQAISTTLERAGVAPEEIGMVCAHANGTVSSDASEGLAISKCFNKQKIPVTGFKWSTGHTLSAAGVIESILTLLALGEQKLPGIASLTQKDALFESLAVSSCEQPLNASLGLLITRAFYSLTSCLLLKV